MLGSAEARPTPIEPTPEWEHWEWVKSFNEVDVQYLVADLDGNVTSCNELIPLNCLPATGRLLGGEYGH